MESATQPMDMHPMLNVTNLTMNMYCYFTGTWETSMSIEYLSLGNLVCEADIQNHCIVVRVNITIVNKIKT